ncbi:MFS transporter [Pyrobaculum calidifontis]|uniref:CBS domain containing protein n=1 Tax=Pyrobaculum calidifontis (strain DSM 21063 / JCM 11548 / VA1) TaxID=410359 RepID=A3MT49_PYRCJ|nr:MFS transporter [Pyrobaculum calidifontis]ABO07816.1 CBS domain containing protein [Pyrobaculum calidifontis JCM 11548]
MSVQVNFRQVASVAIVAWFGAFLEWLDFYTYALLAGLVAKIFFPSADPIASLLASFAALAIGFLFRPLGAIVFGKIGDQFGRKVAFITAMSLMLVGTLGIGLLPGYAEIGILASVGVFILRIIQGLALGGGYGAAITYLGEFVPEHRRGFFTGFLFTTPAAGMATVGALIWLFSTMLGTQQYNAWGWRLNFIVAGVIVFIIVLAMHLFYKETPVFSMLRAVRRVTSAPIREVFSRKYLPLVLLAWIGVVGAHGPIWYTNQLFNTYYVGPNFQKYVDSATASALLSTATYAALWMYPLFGYISDKVGRKPILLLGIYGNALWFPIAFWLIDQVGPQKDLTALWLLFWSMTLFNGIGYSGAMSAFLLELFPARIRLSAVSLAYNLGYGVTGGLTPFVITWLYSITKNVYLSTILWSTVVPMVMALWYALKGPETLGTRIWAEFAAEKFAKKTVTLPATTPIREVVKAMVDTGVKYVVLTGSVVGIFGTRSLIRALAAGAKLDEPAGNYAVKTSCIDAKAPVTEVFVALEQYNVRAVPVCEGGKPVGIVEARELVNEALGLRSVLKKKVALRFNVYDAAPRELVTIAPDKSLKEAIDLMAKYNIGFLPVVEDGKLVGVLSETDIVKAVAKGVDLGRPVAEFANKPIVVDKSATLRDAAELMVKYNIRHIPIVEDGKVVGVISVRDVLKAIG